MNDIAVKKYVLTPGDEMRERRGRRGNYPARCRRTLSARQ